MRRVDFNEGWTCRCLTREEEEYPVSIPHDAMRSEPRTQGSRGENHIGWYTGGDYEYRKLFHVSEEDRDKKILIEFEGVYHNAEVFLNGKKVMSRPYGYTNFYVDTKDTLLYGEENEIRVIAHNSDLPNSRWYSGTGIYRPVYLWKGEEKHIPVNGVKIRTVSYEPAVIQVEVRTSVSGRVQIEIFDDSGQAAAAAGADTAITERLIEAASETKVSKEPASEPKKETKEKAARTKEPENRAIVRMDIPSAKLWNCDTPSLYLCRVTFGEDIVEEHFGIRLLEWNKEAGLAINGKRVILRGACIHHDNGILGACAFPEAEERKVRRLKENGYNALRSAHNPCSKAILDACDRLGMLMMDEYVDVWYIHKTENDYVEYLPRWWKQDLKDMVEKDYNHPSVILYSTGNEVSETAQKKGIRLTGQFTQYLHLLDSTRPVTCGINIFFNFLSSIGFGVYSDEKAKKSALAAQKNAQESQRDAQHKAGSGKKKPVGSEFYNTLACLAGDYFMKCGATLYPCDLKTRDAFANMDIAGYNYGIFRYLHDLKKYPDRLILGTETFCKDAYSFWEKAKRNPRILGDFVWAGMDYIGETGEGAAEYPDYKEENPACRMTGGNGRVDLLGKPRAEAAFTRVAFEQESGPIIAVNPVYQKEKLNLTGWQLTKALESWSWHGCGGQPAVVEVYARAAEVELLVNGKAVGRKSFKNTCRRVFKTKYEDGEITAVSYDDTGRVIGRQTLKTAGKETELRIRPEEQAAKPGQLVFIPLQYTDAEGIWKPMVREKLTVSVENGRLMGLGSANAYVEGNYTQDTANTYYGEAMAVVRAGETGAVKVTVTDSMGRHTAKIPVYGQ